ncbi:hypothetical protein EV138_0627 [Kribbella voronezhensis]|uniref:O-antigen ligase-like membrane protein n=1 Tax=Kribbella voronezhensis TaxID=2512212 RepID=A0A4R7T5H8_9ACTN|nr:hypothetical protein [Kribbella voronezhensis]TDU87110.1 hypothetical protein EV138_0627 [Kribbella voronezhensis]
MSSPNVAAGTDAVSAAAVAGPRRRRRWSAGWPLSVLFLGFPLWWVLGLTEFAFFLAAIPMAWSLISRRTVIAPRGFGWWIGFLAVVLVSGTMLTTDAPFSNLSPLGNTLLTYTFRLIWYLSVTIVLLYVGNTSQADLPTAKVVRLLAYMFVVTAFGGLLGVVAPHFEFKSVLELVLPHSAATNRFVHALIHPATADIQSVLGFAQPRPRAPFSYANSWGANLSFYLPFFLYSWFGRDAGWRKVAAVPVLIVAAVPVVYSLNRGLWGVLVIGMLYAVVQVIRLRGFNAVAWLAPVGVLMVVGALLSPLPTMVSERFAHQHSNERRGELAIKTIESTIKGSPLIGFGNTRDVEGSFGSIAGGATLGCPACAVPPFGTQGHLWLVIFAQGLLGTAVFLAFFLIRFARHVRSRDPVAMIGVALIIFFLIEIFVYDTLGSPLFTLMIALALMWRADRDQQAARLPATEQVVAAR